MCKYNGLYKKKNVFNDINPVVFDIQEDYPNAEAGHAGDIN